MLTELSESLVRYIKAAKEYEKAAEKCDHDHGYFLHHEAKRLEETEQKFIEALQERLAKPNQS